MLPPQTRINISSGPLVFFTMCRELDMIISRVSGEFVMVMNVIVQSSISAISLWLVSCESLCGCYFNVVVIETYISIFLPFLQWSYWCWTFDKIYLTTVHEAAIAVYCNYTELNYIWKQSFFFWSDMISFKWLAVTYWLMMVFF